MEELPEEGKQVRKSLEAMSEQSTPSKFARFSK